MPANWRHVFVADDVRGIRKHDSGLMQTRIAFAAYPDRIVTVELIRWVKQRLNGSYGPKGDWVVKDHQVHTAVGEPRTGRGTVKVGPLTHADTDGSVGGGDAIRREFENAVYAETFLPPQVRTDLAQTVPAPAIHIGQLVSNRSQQTLELLRLDTRSAVVLVGTRVDDPTMPWDIIRRQYTFDPGRAITA